MFQIFPAPSDQFREDEIQSAVHAILERFEGSWYHTGQWPHEGVDFTAQSEPLVAIRCNVGAYLPIPGHSARRRSVRLRRRHRPARRTGWCGADARVGVAHSQPRHLVGRFSAFSAAWPVRAVYIERPCGVSLSWDSWLLRKVWFRITPQQAFRVAAASGFASRSIGCGGLTRRSAGP
jgi:hypothetical protein